MNANDFLYFILDKHHEGQKPHEELEREYAGEDEPLRLADGCEWIDDVDKPV